MQTAKLNYLLVLIAFIWLSCEGAAAPTGTTGTRIAPPPPTVTQATGTPVTPPSSITNFTLNIDSPTKTITVFLPQDGKSAADWLDTDLSNHILDLTTITPEIQGLGYTSIAPASGTAQDFSFNRKVDYTATKADGTTDTYTVRVRIKAADRATLLALITGGITNTAKFGPTGNYNFIDTSAVTKMHELFKGNTTFNGDITEWNVSSVTHMDQMFKNATTFNKDIGNWNVARVINMDQMFNNARAFNKDIGNWNVARVKNMSQMFYKATAFNQDIGNWNVARVTNMHGMFQNAAAFNQDIGNWNVAKVGMMYQMFYSAAAFAQDLEDWKDHFPGGTPPIATNAFTGTSLTSTSTPPLPSWYTP